jgi:hypothetical protein
MLVVATSAARLGVLPSWGQFALVAVGLVLCAATTARGRATRERYGGAEWFAFGAVGILLVLAAIDFALPVADGANHAFVIKRLWDTGALPGLHHQAGSQLVGESLFSLVNGARFVGAFEGELCAALLILLLVSELKPDRHGIRHVVLVVTSLAILLDLSLVDDEARWSAALLLVGAFFAIRAGLRAGHASWHAIVISVALGALRHEYLLLAVPYAVAAGTLPTMTCPPAPSRRLAALAGWILFLVGFQVALAVPLTQALVNAVLLSGLAVFALRIACGLGILLRYNDALMVALFAATTSGLAVWLDAIRPAQHSNGATFAIGFALAISVVVHLADEHDREDTDPLTRAAVILAVGAFAVVTVLGPSFSNTKRAALTDRFTSAVVTLRDLDKRGIDNDAAYHVRLLQHETPHGASIGFWGQNAELLDFRRNAIRDISWPPGASSRRRKQFLSPMTSRSLARLDYVIVEDVPTPPVVDPWTLLLDDIGRPLSYASPIEDVQADLEPVASAGAAALYRVRSAR